MWHSNSDLETTAQFNSSKYRNYKKARLQSSMAIKKKKKLDEYDLYKSALAQKLEYYLSILGPTYRDFIDELGLNENMAISWIEKKSVPPLDMIPIIASYLRISPKHLIDADFDLKSSPRNIITFEDIKEYLPREYLNKESPTDDLSLSEDFHAGESVYIEDYLERPIVEVQLITGETVTGTIFQFTPYIPKVQEGYIGLTITDDPRDYLDDLLDDFEDGFLDTKQEVCIWHNQIKSISCY